MRLRRCEQQASYRQAGVTGAARHVQRRVAELVHCLGVRLFSRTRDCALFKRMVSLRGYFYGKIVCVCARACA